MWISRLQLFFGAMVLTVLGYIAGVFLTPPVSRTERAAQPAGRPGAEARTVAARGDLLPAEKHTVDLFERASKSVVYITTLAVQADFFSRNLAEIPVGSGSGFIWDEAGHVVTGRVEAGRSDPPGGRGAQATSRREHRQHAQRVANVLHQVAHGVSLRKQIEPLRHRAIAAPGSTRLASQWFNDSMAQQPL